MSSDHENKVPDTQLYSLSIPFPDKHIEKKEGSDYVGHAIVNQRILGTLGPFSMRIDQVIRGNIDERITSKGTPREKKWPSRTNAVVGVVLTCVFTIDGKQVEISEIGEPEGYYMADHDGERLKKAVSDAFKRCAMRIGVGLHLWSKNSYFLPAMLQREADKVVGGHIKAEIDADGPDPDALDPDEKRRLEESEVEPPALLKERASVTLAPEPELESEPDQEEHAVIEPKFEPINSEQESMLREIIRGSGVEPYKFAEYLQYAFGVSKLNQLDVAQARQVMVNVQDEDIVRHINNDEAVSGILKDEVDQQEEPVNQLASGQDQDVDVNESRKEFQKELSQCKEVRDYAALFDKVRRRHGDTHQLTRWAKDELNKKTEFELGRRKATH